MNLSEAFSVLAQSRCRLKVEAEGGIILDIPTGSPPVPRTVLEALAAHREALLAVLKPTSPSSGTDDSRPEGAAGGSACCPSCLANRSTPPGASTMAPALHPQLGTEEILARAKAKLEAARSSRGNAGGEPRSTSSVLPSGPPAGEAISPADNDGIPF